mmetsp:Transcript_66701/g.217088  ORF Transcript_66701/g.217088 Transcript_66701/m.217088 type:complete len:1095 (+) Transcript_66701:76-3360(+)
MARRQCLAAVLFVALFSGPRADGVVAVDQTRPGRQLQRPAAAAQQSATWLEGQKGYCWSGAVSLGQEEQGLSLEQCKAACDVLFSCNTVLYASGDRSCVLGSQPTWDGGACIEGSGTAAGWQTFWKPLPTCEDEGEKCADGAGSGLCVRDPVNFLVRCRRSCGACPDAPAGLLSWTWLSSGRCTNEVVAQECEALAVAIGAPDFSENEYPATAGHRLGCTQDMHSGEVRYQEREAGSPCTPSERCLCRGEELPFDPASPLVMYVDVGACGFRGDDAKADTSSCGPRAEDARIVSKMQSMSGQPVARIAGCSYMSYTIYACTNIAVSTSLRGSLPAMVFPQPKASTSSWVAASTIGGLGGSGGSGASDTMITTTMPTTTTQAETVLVQGQATLRVSNAQTFEADKVVQAACAEGIAGEAVVRPHEVKVWLQLLPQDNIAEEVVKSERSTVVLSFEIQVHSSLTDGSSAVDVDSVAQRVRAKLAQGDPTDRMERLLTGAVNKVSTIFYNPRVMSVVMPKVHHGASMMPAGMPGVTGGNFSGDSGGASGDGSFAAPSAAPSTSSHSVTSVDYASIMPADMDVDKGDNFSGDSGGLSGNGSVAAPSAALSATLAPSATSFGASMMPAAKAGVTVGNSSAASVAAPSATSAAVHSANSSSGEGSVATRAGSGAPPWAITGLALALLVAVAGCVLTVLQKRGMLGKGSEPGYQGLGVEDSAGRSADEYGREVEVGGGAVEAQPGDALLGGHSVGPEGGDGHGETTPKGDEEEGGSWVKVVVAVAEQEEETGPAVEEEARDEKCAPLEALKRTFGWLFEPRTTDDVTYTAAKEGPDDDEVEGGHQGAHGEDLEAETLGTCTLGHPLQRHQTQEAGFVCDGCAKEQPEGTSIWACEACNFDLCHGCVAAQAEGRSAPHDSPAGGGIAEPDDVPRSPTSADVAIDAFPEILVEEGFTESQQRELESLEEMGFPRDQALRALEDANWNVAQAMEALFAGGLDDEPSAPSPAQQRHATPSPAPLPAASPVPSGSHASKASKASRASPSPAPAGAPAGSPAAHLTGEQEESVQVLMGMGFERDVVLEVLKGADWDMTRASNHLFAG